MYGIRISFVGLGENPEGGRRPVDVKHTFSSSKGVVEEVHFPFRDGILMPYPCFLTSARFEQGMSGGPILGTKNNMMNVIGIVTRGMGRPLDSEEYTEWAILAGQLLTIEVEYVDHASGNERRCFLADLPTSIRPSFDETLQDITISKERHITTFDYGAGRVRSVVGTWDV